MRDTRYLRCLGRSRKKPRAAYGEWLKFLRHQSGKTQQQVQMELCDKLRIPSTCSHVIADWEGNGKLPGRDLIVALAEIYNVSLETILGVQKLPNGRYMKTEGMIKQALLENESRTKSIQEKNHDPML